MTEIQERGDARPPKVFGIGFHKTGTSTLTEILRAFGYRVTGPNWTTEEDIADTYLERCRALSRTYDGFQDNPWPLVYREMDRMWPGSKFILTTRDEDKWIQSQIKHFGRRETPMRRLIYGEKYGRPAGNADHYVSVFRAHNAAVRDYFRGRENDLLEIDLTKTPQWQPICDFLGVDVPDLPFPHANSRESRMRNDPLWKRMVKKVLLRI